MEEQLDQIKTNNKKVVLFGPESTGKTTLSKQIAKYFNTLWVPEYAREYLQKKWDSTKKTCERSDILPIAIGQMKKENELSLSVKNLLICDTNLLETKVYSEIYFNGYCDQQLQKYALKNKYDLYFLTGIDVPWTPDDLRDKPNERKKMYLNFKDALTLTENKFVELEGNKQERLKKAILTINQYLDV